MEKKNIMCHFKALLFISLSISFISCVSEVQVELYPKGDLDTSSSPLENVVDNPPLVSSSTPSNGTEDSESIIALNYTDSDSDLATSCSVSNLSNVTITTACSCDGAGVCTVGVTGTSGYFGSASFDYTVVSNSVTSNTTSISYTIDSVAISCPSGFVAVDGNGVLGTLDFCVMKYEAKCDGVGACDATDTTSLPISQAAGSPWVSIRADESAIAGSGAQARCEAMSETGFTGTFSLISNPEWMTIARDIENTASNWSSGIIGSGHIPRGHSDNSPSNALVVTDVNDPYIGTGNNSGEAAGSGWEQKRTHTLSNGSEIWDLSGNVHERVDWDSTSAGFTLGPVDEALGSNEFGDAKVGSLLNDSYLPEGAYTSVNSFGVWVGGGSGAALRGGHWADDSNAGPFALLLNFPPWMSMVTIGFRCSYRP